MKGWRTIAINVLTFLVAMFAWEDLTKFLDPQQIVLGAAVVNMALRWVTTTAVGQAPPAADSGPTPPAAHGSVVLLVAAAMGLSACSALPKFSEVAPLICSYATLDEAQKAVNDLAAKLPDGTDKTRVQKGLVLAEESADAVCVFIKAMEAKRAAQSAASGPSAADRLLPEKP